MRGTRGATCRATATPAAAALKGAPPALAKRIDAFSKNGGLIVNAANELASATVGWVNRSARR